MNHAELSRDLALAIGWRTVVAGLAACPDSAAVRFPDDTIQQEWRKFDYRAPTVWGPVLEWLMREHRFPAYWSRIAEKFVIPGADNRIECDTLPEAAALPWQKRSMELAIVTAQSLQEVADMTFANVKDGFLWCHRTKTGLHIKLPLSLTVPELGWNLGDVIRACRDRVVSRHLVHHSKPMTNVKPGDPVHENTVSKGFRRARIAAGVTGDHPPTFHEIRSLALRLYGDKYGKDFAQSLAGHKDSATTAVYLDVRGAEWLEVKFGG